MAQAVANGCGVDAEPGRRASMHIEKDGPLLQFAAHRLQEALAHGLKEGMTRRDPLDGREAFENFLVEDELLVLAAESAESRLQLLADRPEMTGHAGAL